MTNYGCPICGRVDWNCGKPDCPNLPQNRVKQNLFANVLSATVLVDEQKTSDSLLYKSPPEAEMLRKWIKDSEGT